MCYKHKYAYCVACVCVCVCVFDDVFSSDSIVGQSTEEFGSEVEWI